MKKVDKKKNSVKKKKNIQTTKKRKTKKVTASQKNNVVKNDVQKKTTSKTTKTENTKKLESKITKENIDKTKSKTKLEKIETNSINKNNKLSLTKSITIPRLKLNIDNNEKTKTITIPKLKEKALSLTKSITIPKLKDKALSLTKSISIPKIKDKDITEIELDLFDDKNYKIAENLYKEKKYDEAYSIFLNLLEKYKKDKRLYKRLISTLTKDYTYKNNTKEFKRVFDDYVTTYKILANKKEINSLEYNLETYKNVKITKKKSKFLLIAFLGYFGIHRFIDKKIISGILYLLTFGFLGIGVIVDLINDYAEYEDTLQLDILRYLIAFAIMIVGVLNKQLENFYLIIIASIIFLPIIYSFILKYIPGIIKLIAMIVLIIFGFKTEQIIEYVPNNIIGNWITTNESTNYEKLDIKLEKTTLYFDDRDKETGTNEYDAQNKILEVKINDTKSYRFIINIEENKICSYTESKECIIEFNKETK